MVIAELVEDLAEMRHDPRPGVRIDQGARFLVQLGADARDRRGGLLLKLHLGDLGRRHEAANTVSAQSNTSAANSQFLLNDAKADIKRKVPSVHEHRN